MIKPKRPRDQVQWLFRTILGILGLIAILMVWRGCRTATILVPAKDIAAYHLIEAADLTIKRVSPNEVRPDLLLTQKDFVNSYARVPLKIGQPVAKDQVGFVKERGLIVNTLVVDIPISRLQFASDIAPGEIVSLTAIPKQPDNAPPILVLSEALVLNVSRPGKDSITVAVPMTQWVDYLAKTSGAQLVLAKLAK